MSAPLSPIASTVPANVLVRSEREPRPNIQLDETVVRTLDFGDMDEDDANAIRIEHSEYDVSPFEDADDIDDVTPRLPVASARDGERSCGANPDSSSNAVSGVARGAQTDQQSAEPVTSDAVA